MKERKRKIIWPHANQPLKCREGVIFLQNSPARSHCGFREKYPFIFIPKLKVCFGNGRKRHDSLLFLANTDMSDNGKLRDLCLVGGGRRVWW